MSFLKKMAPIDNCSVQQVKYWRARGYKKCPMSVILQAFHAYINWRSSKRPDMDVSQPIAGKFDKLASFVDSELETGSPWREQKGHCKNV